MCRFAELSAATFGQTEVARALINAGADLNISNNDGSTALESVAGRFDQVKGVYDLLQAVLGPAGLKLDLDQINATRPLIQQFSF